MMDAQRFLYTLQRIIAAPAGDCHKLSVHASRPQSHYCAGLIEARSRSMVFQTNFLDDFLKK